MKQFLKARAVEGALGYTQGQQPQVAVSFVVTEGERAGARFTWHGYFTDKTQERTIESLRHCGWQGDNLADLSGLDANEVELVVEEEEYNGTVREKVQWVNRAGGIAMKDRMNAAQAAAFANSMRGLIIQKKQAAGPVPAAPKSGTAPRNGTPAKSPPQQQATGTNGGGGYTPAPREPGDDTDEIPFVVDMTTVRTDVV